MRARRWIGALAAIAGASLVPGPDAFRSIPAQGPSLQGRSLQGRSLQGRSPEVRAERSALASPTHFAGAWLDEWFFGTPARSLVQYARIARNNRYDLRSRQLATARQCQLAIALGESDRLRSLDRELRRGRRRRDGQGPTARTAELLRMAEQRFRARNGSGEPATTASESDPAMVDAWAAVTNEQLTWIERAPWALGRSMWLAPGATDRRIASSAAL